MAPAATSGPRRRARAAAPAENGRRLAVSVLVAGAALIVLALTAFGSSAPARLETAPALPELAPARPSSQIVALQGPLRVQLPIAQSRVTAIGYHAAGQGALALEPLGKQGNRGLLRRFADWAFGTSGSGDLVYYRLPGGSGPSTSALDVGAAPETDVFSPVDGTVIGITDYELDGRRRGVRVDIQPTAAPSLVVSVTRLRPDPLLTVGSPVVAASSRLGAVLDLSSIERHALARYTQDAGNHVTLEVRPAATLALP